MVRDPQSPVGGGTRPGDVCPAGSQLRRSHRLTRSWSEGCSGGVRAARCMLCPPRGLIEGPRAPRQPPSRAGATWELWAPEQLCCLRTRPQRPGASGIHLVPGPRLAPSAAAVLLLSPSAPRSCRRSDRRCSEHQVCDSGAAGLGSLCFLLRPRTPSASLPLLRPLPLALTTSPVRAYAGTRGFHLKVNRSSVPRNAFQIGAFPEAAAPWGRCLVLLWGRRCPFLPGLVVTLAMQVKCLLFAWILSRFCVPAPVTC